MISENSISELKSRLDIVDIVSQFVELKKAGRTFKACCPFHSEKTPSFVVDPAKNIFHCFGCGAGGDSITFIMEIEKLNYKEAIERLAEMMGFTLEYDKKEYKGDNKILDFMCEFYKKNLNHNTKEYIKSRGINAQSAERFELGYAPSNIEIMNYLNRNMINLQNAAELGVLGVDSESGGRRFYARLVERLIFPIRNANGKIVGFGGRTMGNHPAKYINSPQTKLFNKSRILYGYNLAKQSIFSKNEIIICEGYLDTLMLHQAGFTNAVATLGTALTEQHMPLISRAEPRVLLAYDGDNAGRAAAFKASLMLAKAQKSGGVVLFFNPNNPNEKIDPADMVQNGQISELKALIAAPQPFIDYALEYILNKYNLNDPLKKDAALKECVEFLSTLSKVIAQEYRAFLANTLNLPLHLINLKTQKNSQKTPNISQNTQEQANSYSELSEKTIIKSVLENENLLDFVLSFLEQNMFISQNAAFSALLNGEKNSPLLLGILLDEKILALNKEDLKKQIIMVLVRHFEDKLKQIKDDKNLEISEKLFLIKKIQLYLADLQKGELRVYESVSTF